MSAIYSIPKWVNISLSLALPLTALGQANYATPYTFSTLAGQPTVGTNDGTGGAAQFHYPQGVAVDSAGNVYVADSGNYTIRKVTPTGLVTTLAVRLGNPTGVAVDSAGNIYVADTGNSTIRKVTPAGVVTTLAGQPGIGGTNDGTNSAARFGLPLGVAVDSATNLYVADTGNGLIRKVTPVGTNWVVTTLAGLGNVAGGVYDGTNSAALFDYPGGVAVDSAGNLYVADTMNSTIRKVTPEGTNWVVTTLAGQRFGLVLNGEGVYVPLTNNGNADGNGSAARFFWPYGVAVDSATNVYVADSYNNTIRELTPVGTNWVVTTLAGQEEDYMAEYPQLTNSGSADGTGSAAQFDLPNGVAVDSAGNLFVADVGNNAIRRGFPANGTPVILTYGAGLAFGNGLFGFNLAAAAGQPVVVDASTDLVTWLSIWTNTVGPGVLPFSDPQSGAYLNRFYRAHLP